ncbi:MULTISPECIES: hypothetical protein [unclassified Vibrio]|uniref:Lipoprotein n=1 Tax=Vibrio sp. HB236076 TaxID=3232307 RepID=A0AB39HES0_9VIBR|nr:hypothetical protein [Vibrio sp. HB161653]MDP5255344.1 hypothetical protein [Vibrio sp. HB161653]
MKKVMFASILASAFVLSGCMGPPGGHGHGHGRGHFAHNTPVTDNTQAVAVDQASNV